MNAIQLVKRDHQAVERLFKRFERAEKGGRPAELQQLVQSLTKELSVHAAIEEQVLYPALRRAEEGAEDEVLEALEEHHLVKLTLAELEKLGPEDERYCAKMNVLIEGVRHHVKEEEGELLPRLRRAFPPKELQELGQLLADAKKAAPTRPHPGAPDTPPGNLLAGALASILDRGRDALRGAAEGGRKTVERHARAVKRRTRRVIARGRELASRPPDEEQPAVH